MVNFDTTLDTPRLRLRLLALSDVDFVFRHFSDPQVTRYLLDEPPFSSRAEAVELIEFYQQSHKSNRWGIEHKADGVLAGTCGFHNWDQKRFRAEIGYDLSPGYWGQGLMVEALRSALSFGFQQMQLNRIEALIYVENPQSARVLEKLGFRREGLLRDYFYLNGQFYDHYVYSLLRRDAATADVRLL
jgi:[ribosomal protein S5]-alanine N-acetyltransferase